MKIFYLQQGGCRLFCKQINRFPVDNTNSTLVFYLFIVVAIRLFGKKELAQLSVVDLVFILLISNAVQNAMVGRIQHLVAGWWLRPLYLLLIIYSNIFNIIFQGLIKLLKEMQRCLFLKGS
jgi:uncharacterized membrane protein YcaP (DUF421 family)